MNFSENNRYVHLRWILLLILFAVPMLTWPGQHPGHLPLVASDAVGSFATAPDRGCTEPASGHLTLSIFSLDSGRGRLTVNGLDSRRPTRMPFTWIWGDGIVTEGWFPQSHVYTNTKKSYALQVISHEDDGSTDCEQILIPISDGRIIVTSIAAGEEASSGSTGASDKTIDVPGVATLN
jgi:hypothetical protein